MLCVVYGIIKIVKNSLCLGTILLGMNFALNLSCPDRFERICTPARERRVKNFVEIDTAAGPGMLFDHDHKSSRGAVCRVWTVTRLRE